MRLIFIFSIFFTLQTANAYMVKTTDYSGQHKHILSFKMDFNDRLKPTESSKGVMLKIDGSTYYLFKNQLLNVKKEVLCDFQDPSLKVAPKKKYINSLLISAPCPTIEDILFVRKLRDGGRFFFYLNTFDELNSIGETLINNKKIRISFFGGQDYFVYIPGGEVEKEPSYYEKYQSLHWRESRTKIFQLPIDEMIDDWRKGEKLNLLGYLLNDEGKKENNEKISFKIEWKNNRKKGIVTPANLKYFKYKDVLLKIIEQHFRLMKTYGFFQVPGGFKNSISSNFNQVYYINNLFLNEIEVGTYSNFGESDSHNNLLIYIKFGIKDSTDNPFVESKL